MNKAQKEFSVDANWRPLIYIENGFEAQGEVVIDYATGLMWQQSGSETDTNYKKSQEYIQELNQKKFAGYADWRLPTVPELLSLVEPKKSSNGLYISSLFNNHQWWCLRADKGSSGSAWLVYFKNGFVRRSFLNSYYVHSVRAVRSMP